MKREKIKIGSVIIKTDGVQPMGIFSDYEYKDKDYSIYYLLLPSVFEGNYSKENHQNMHACKRISDFRFWMRNRGRCVRYSGVLDVTRTLFTY